MTTGCEERNWNEGTLIGLDCSLPDVDCRAIARGISRSVVPNVGSIGPFSFGSTNSAFTETANREEELKSIEVANFSKAYNVREDSAEILLTVIEEYFDGGRLGAQSLGLSKRDIKRLSKLKKPTAKGIDKVSETLLEDPEVIEDMFVKILKSVKEQIKKEIEGRS